MKVKTTAKIEIILHYILVVLFFPIGVIGFVFDKIVQMLRFVIYLRDKLLFIVGNKLLLASEESKEITNEYYLKHFTAKSYNELLKKKNNNKLDIIMPFDIEES